jgi:DNA-binding FrmR family transcriptional regulator
MSGTEPDGTQRRRTTAEELVARLRKIEGHVRGLQHTVERGEACADALTQIAAARAALAAAAVRVFGLGVRAHLGSPDTDETLERLVRL